MNEFVILTDSSCDLPGDLARKLELEVIYLSVLIEGKTYQNDLDEKSITNKATYQLFREGKASKTSAASVGQFEEVMEPLLQAGKDLLYIGFSSGLSGTYNAGQIAAQELSEKYPERKVYTVDTLCASLGQGMMVYLAAQERFKGKTIEEVRDFVEENKLKLAHWFTVDDLNFLYRGGRVSKTTAVIGSMLSMKPIMHVDNAGKLVKVSVARGRKASINAMFDKMKQTAIDPEHQVIFISHGDCLEDAKLLAQKVKDAWNVPEVIINYVGPVIGSHSGPGTLALFFLATER